MNKTHPSDFPETESLLLSMISDSLTQTETHIEDVGRADSALLHELTEFAAHQSVLPIIYHRLSKEKNLTGNDREYLKMMTQSTAMEFYQILFNARDSIELLQNHGIPVVLLKGASAARYYPVPESRKSSDIDLFLLHEEDVSRAFQILEANGYPHIKEQHATHHEIFGTPDGHVLELHTMLLEPTENKRVNEYVAKRYSLSEDKLLKETVLGCAVPVFSDDHLAFHLLLHMQMEFLSAGFGLKLLCDWVVFWNRKVPPTLTESFLHDVENCGLKEFLSVITSICISYLGLRADGSGTLYLKNGTYYYKNGIFCKSAPEQLVHDFLNDVLDAERDGKPDDTRMVALQNVGPLSYITAFHHLTKLSFPKASRWIISLPVLYIAVFGRFLYNNRKLRGGQSVFDVISSTKTRSRLAKQIFSKTP